eukprot:CAMPEP_0201613538 /NCGR_PEP_ID=MMETSP0492-20130828/26288_1 /ASSEMBLY_ACC=CAM_ASM_000837 /TAXON_ID=420259 /ORGANISM="Thalassiosira gravida, Strain GMp14c1" /LENGTH=31 /DNA_ID= /DNA_START= /DNA_END= /DNA_ORIENTATION=
MAMPGVAFPIKDGYHPLGDNWKEECYQINCG